MVTKASAPGKVILLGEHAAVYGNPVLVAAIDLRSYVTVKKRDDSLIVLDNPAVNVNNFKFLLSQLKKLKTKWNLALSCESIEKVESYLGEKSGLEISIKSDVPVSSGMGSSASIAAALVLAISKELGYDLNKKEIAKLAWDIENIIHGKSSGVDPHAVTYGGVIRYEKGKVKQVKLKEYPEIIIGNTLIPSNTKEAVGLVMKLKQRYPEFFEKYLEASKILVDYGEEFLAKGDIKALGEVMNINHGLLAAIGVSSLELEKLVWASRKKGYGSKLCGAGIGGIIIALGSEEVREAIEKVGGKVISARISKEGVRLEK